MQPSASRLRGMSEWSLIEQHLDRLEKDYVEELIQGAANGNIDMVTKMGARIEMIRDFRAMPDEIIGESDE